MADGLYVIGYVGAAVKVGVALGAIDGSHDGELLGKEVFEGDPVGTIVDLNVGAVGRRVGALVVGFRVGIIEGVRVGLQVGMLDGL